LKEEQQGDDNVDGSDDDNFSTTAAGGDVYSLPRRNKKGVVKLSSSATVDTLNESQQISAGLHEKQRVGNEVNSMYDEEQVAAPDDEIYNPIDAPLSKAEVCIDVYYPFQVVLFSRHPHHTTFMLSVVI